LFLSIKTLTGTKERSLQMQELEKHRGFVGCGVTAIVIGITGALGVYLGGGGEPPPALIFGGLVVAIALGIGTWKNTRWARIPTGVLLTLVGAALSIFIIVDFATYLTGGQSLMTGPGSESFGQAVFILFMTGLALLGIGLYMLRVLKPT
jgi:hypothetical protein